MVLKGYMYTPLIGASMLLIALMLSGTVASMERYELSTLMEIIQSTERVSYIDIVEGDMASTVLVALRAFVRTELENGIVSLADLKKKLENKTNFALDTFYSIYSRLIQGKYRSWSGLKADAEIGRKRIDIEVDVASPGSLRFEDRGREVEVLAPAVEDASVFVDVETIRRELEEMNKLKVDIKKAYIEDRPYISLDWGSLISIADYKSIPPKVYTWTFPYYCGELKVHCRVQEFIDVEYRMLKEYLNELEEALEQKNPGYDIEILFEDRTVDMYMVQFEAVEDYDVDEHGHCVNDESYVKMEIAPMGEYKYIVVKSIHVAREINVDVPGLDVEIPVKLLSYEGVNIDPANLPAGPVFIAEMKAMTPTAGGGPMCWGDLKK